MKEKKMLMRLRRMVSNWKVIWRGRTYCKGCEEKNKLDAFERELDEFVTQKLKENDFFGLQEKLGDSFVPVMIRRGEFSRLYWCMNEKDLSNVSMEHGMYSRVIDIRISLEGKPCNWGPRRELGLFGTGDYPPLFQMKKRGGSVWAIDDSSPPEPKNETLEAILVEGDEPVLSVDRNQQQILGMLTKCYSKGQSNGISKTLSEESSTREDAREAPEKSGKD